MDLQELLAVVSDVKGSSSTYELSADLRSEVGLDGLQLLALLGRLEHRGGIQFPPDLIESLETVDDVLYYFNTISSHSGARREV